MPTLVVIKIPIFNRKAQKLQIIHSIHKLYLSLKIVTKNFSNLMNSRSGIEIDDIITNKTNNKLYIIKINDNFYTYLLMSNKSYQIS